MDTLLTVPGLRRQNEEFRGSGGVSARNRSLGFAPAFLDSDTGQIYRSCFRDGRPAPCHLLDGLPAPLWAERDEAGQSIALKAAVVAGFVCGGRFYTREEAAQAVSEAGRGELN